MILIFDLLVDQGAAKVGAEAVQKLKTELCAQMFQEGAEKKRMETIKKVLETTESDVAALLEIPANWLEGKLEEKEEEEQVLAKTLTDWHVAISPRKLDSADNSVLLLRKKSFATPDVSKLTKQGHLAVSVKPTGFETAITFMVLHLDSKGKTGGKENRQVGIADMIDKKMSDLSVIAASDTNGEPRNIDYVGEKTLYEDDDKKFIFEQPWSFEEKLAEYNTKTNSKYHVFRATDAPYGAVDKVRDTPAFGTCNKQRTSMQAQRGKVDKADRLMKDNMYFKTVENGVTVQQKDLCGEDCSKYTFGGNLKCFKQQTTEQLSSLLDPRSFPMTCGYVGEKTTLPDMKADYGISDHAPIMARFLLTDKASSLVEVEGTAKWSDSEGSSGQVANNDWVQKTDLEDCAVTMVEADHIHK